MDSNKTMNTENNLRIGTGSVAEQLFKVPVAEPVQSNPTSFTDASANLYRGTDGQLVDNNAFGKTSFPEIKIQPTSDEDMNDVLGPVFAEANKQVARLQKEIDENPTDANLALRNKDIISMYKPVVDAGNRWSTYYTDQQNQRAVIEAQEKEDAKLVAEAEALVSSVDENTDLESVTSQIKEIMRKLHVGDALFGLMVKLANLKARKMATV